MADMYTDALYRSGTSLEKTDKEKWRDSVANLIGDLSDEAILDIGKLKVLTLHEIWRALKDARKGN